MGWNWIPCWASSRGGGEKKYNIFLVTNKHVLLNKQHIVVRFNAINNLAPKDYPINLVDASGDFVWVGHPDVNVDVATFHIDPNMLKNDGADFQFFALDEHALTCSQMKDVGVSEGDGIFVLGFPMGIVDSQKMNAIARVGAISRIRDVLAGNQTAYIVDANIFPGNSGGPVVNKPEHISIQDTKAIDKSSLIGVVKSYIPYQDVAISQQTGNPRVIFEENSGLAWVETVDSVIQVVDDCYVQKLSHIP